VIDTHVHFWNPDRWAYPWLDEVPALRRAYLPTDFATDAGALDGVIFVEAGGGGGDPLAEVGWVEDLASRWPALLAIVAHAPLESGAGAALHLRKLAGRPLVKGCGATFRMSWQGSRLPSHSVPVCGSSPTMGWRPTSACGSGKWAK
jgi:L-fuconolactonase